MVLALAISLPASALAWGTQGHSMISRAAVQSLPTEVPAFVRSQAAIDEIAYLGPEEDRLKGSGESFDTDRFAGHFLDIGDDGTVAGVVRLDALPKSFVAYDDALRKAGSSPYTQGFVPYTIIDGFERARMDFAYWRVANYMATHATTAAARARFAAERDLRQSLTLRDIGDWSHFVADGSQPLHITVHFNGWGDYPNPHHYTTKHIHAFFESVFVDRYAKIAAVRALIPTYTRVDPTHLLSQDRIDSAIGRYLTNTAKAVPPLYQLYASGDFQSGSAKAVTFTDQQLARGSTELRNLIALAWEDSLNESVGYPALPVRDILSGKVAPNSSD